MNYKVKSQLDEHTYKDICFIVDSNIEWSKLENKNILITGANGFIGYYLVMSILERNDKFKSNINIIAIVRNFEKAVDKFGEILKRQDFKVIVQDVCNDINIEEKADYIIHAASQASAIQFENDPIGTINANLIGTNKVLNYARKSNTQSILFISSLKVYGDLYNKMNSIKESDIGYIDHNSYKNCYAQGKRSAETLCSCYAKQYGLNVKIVRPSYIYGASSLNDDRVWAQFIANIVKGEDILLKSNGQTLRSFCYIADTVVAMFKVLIEGENITPYNISSQESNIRIRDFAKVAVNCFKEKNLKLVFANKEDEKEPEKSYFDTTPEVLDSTLLESLGWRANISLKKGITRSVKILESKCSLEGK